MYLNLNGNDVGNLVLNMNQSSEKVYLSDVNEGTLTVSTEELAVEDENITVAGASDIDGTLTISTGTYDANGAFDVNQWYFNNWMEKLHICQVQLLTLEH